MSLLKKISQTIHIHSKEFLIIFVCGLIASLPFIAGDLIVGNDYFFNQARLQSTAHALQDGQIVPQVDPSAFGGWGHSWNIFYGPLVTYLILPIKLFTTWPIAINLLSIIFLITSGFTMYGFIFTVTKKRKMALFAGLLFMLASPLVMTALRSNNQSRTLVVTLMPLVFDGLYRIVHQKRAGVILTAVSATGIILSHMLSAVIIAGAALLFLLANLKKFNRSTWLDLAKASALTVGFSAFFLLPFLEASHLHIYNISNSEFQQSAMSMTAQTAFDSSIKPAALLFGNQEFPVPGLYIQLWVLVGAAAIIFLTRKNMTRDVFRYSLLLWVVLAILLWLCTPYVPWNHVPSALYTLQFPSRRLMPLIAFIASILGAIGLYYLLPTIRSQKDNDLHYNVTIISVVITCFTLIAPAINFYSHNQHSLAGPSKTLTHIDDSTSVPESVWRSIVEPWSISSGEYLPTALAEAGNRNPNSTKYYSYTIASANYLTKRGNIPQTSHNTITLHDFSKNGSHMSLRFKNNSRTNVDVELPAIYYPGYQAIIEDSSHTQALTTSPSKNGLLNISLPPSNQEKTVTIWYGLSKCTTIGLLITGFSAVLVLIFTVLKVVRNRRKRA